MKQVHIYAYGEVANFQSHEASNYGVISLKNIVDFVNASPDADEIVVHIHSVGGDVHEGFAIHDFLINTGKKVTTIIEGMCASIATIIALAGSERKMTKNSTFFIHNPWSMGVGDASDFQYMANELKEVENKIINFYSSITGLKIDELSSMMNEEKNISADEAKQKGFITEILEPVKAFAKLNFKNDNMNGKQILETLDKILNKLNIKNEVAPEITPEKKEEPAVKNITEKTKEGKEVFIETETGEAKVGDVITIDGAPVPDATIELENGTVLKTDADSKVSEIVMPAEPNEEMESLKKENEELKAQLTAQNEKVNALENSLNETNSIMAKIEERMTILAKNTTSNFVPEREKQVFASSKKSDSENRIAEKMLEIRNRNKK